jgi:flagellar motor switch/type III secretory pathway protein FliN
MSAIEAAEPVATPPVEAAPAPPAQSPLLGMDGLLAIPVQFDVVLASQHLPVAKLMALQPGAELDLAQAAGGEVSLVANGAVFAHGQLFVMDEVTRQLGIRLTRFVAGQGGAA